MHRQYSIYIFIFFIITLTSCNDKESSIPPPKEQIAEKLRNNCFIIRGYDQSFATGFMLENGWIATNYHVVESNLNKISYEMISSSKGFAYDNIRKFYDKDGCSNIWVESLKIPNVDIKIERCYFNKDADLAILKPSWNFPKEIEGLKLKANIKNDSTFIEPIGTDVYLLGNPIGLDGTFSEGVISAHRKSNNIDYLQITAPMSHGNSGGPLTDKWGNVIGIAQGGFSDGQNLNIAIPSNYLLQLCNSISSAKLNNELDGQKESVIKKNFFKFMRFIEPYLKFIFKYFLIGFVYAVTVALALIIYLKKKFGSINIIFSILITLFHISIIFSIIKYLQDGIYYIIFSSLILILSIYNDKFENYSTKTMLFLYLSWIFIFMILYFSKYYWQPYI